MAKRPLKVFRSSIGFADAYVAAPSQKAALAAWGAGRNLFAAGMAEIVTDPALTKAALAEPGVVVRVSKGTTADHLAAAKLSDKGAGTSAADGGNAHDADHQPPRAAARPARPRPRPSRHKLDEARAALDRHRDDMNAQLAAIDAQVEALRARKAGIKTAGDAKVAALEARIEQQDKAYRQALSRWRG